MQRLRQRPFRRRKPERHVTVRLRMMRDVGFAHQFVESLRRHHRVEPVLLVDASALEDLPFGIAPLKPVEEARPRGHVDRKVLDRLPHDDDDAGFADGACAVHAHHGGHDHMLGWPAALAVFDKLRERSAKPRHRDLAVGMERRQELRPAPLVAIEAPRQDHVGAGLLVLEGHPLIPPGFRRPRSRGSSS